MDTIVKKKKPLQNPVVVIALCCVAVAALYFNTIAPLLKSDEEYYTEDVVEESDAEESNTEMSAEGVLSGNETAVEETQPETVASAHSSDSGPESRDSTTAGNTLHIVGWRRRTSRNPFTGTTEPANNDSQRHPVAVVKKSSESMSSLKRKKPLKRAWKKVPVRAEAENKTTVPLSAIAGGPSRYVALLGSEMVKTGDTNKYGTIIAIDPVSVTIRKNGKLQVITLPNKKQE